ncbi:MAG TPA: hypothetical protein VE198_16015, partial [Actinoallomurus sp.]|nr:hypothetical protein [Actinoallomurus sp.]
MSDLRSDRPGGVTSPPGAGGLACRHPGKQASERRQAHAGGAEHIASAPAAPGLSWARGSGEPRLAVHPSRRLSVASR